MKNPKEIEVKDAWTYFVPAYGVTDDGVEDIKDDQWVIPFVRGDKADPLKPRQMGMMTETLLEVCRLYLEAVNVGDLANQDTTDAIHHIKQALEHLGARSKKRAERGVQGSYQK